MEREFWLGRWQRGETGFHQPEVNAALRQYWPALGITADSTVFVPLCGKSLDMVWLRNQGHHVIGIELAEQAVREFFAEQALEPQEEQRHGLPCFTAENISLYCGDFFALDGAALAAVAAVYDRAALIALPPALRIQYAQHLQQILPRPATILEMTLDYPQQEMQGPPFAVSASELQGLYGEVYDVQLLAQRDALADEARYRERGVSSMHECTYLLRPRALRR